MEVVWKNLKVAEFYKICRLCLDYKELNPLTEEEKNTLIKLTPWIAQVETNVFFPNKICSDCAKQLHQAGEFLNRCSTLSNSFHKCIEEYKEFVKEDGRLPSLETIFVTKTQVTVKQEVEETNPEHVEDGFMPFTEVFVPEERMEYETKFIPQPTTSNDLDSSSSEFDDNVESIESMPVIPGTDRCEILAKIEDSDNESSCYKPDLEMIANQGVEYLLPQKSADKYKKKYDIFVSWCISHSVKNYTENVFLTYFSEIAKSCKPSTLWSTYSMLKSTIMMEHNINIAKYAKLITFIKQKNTGYKPKKSSIFTREDVNKFLIEAPDQSYLMWKVCLIFGIACASRMDDLKKMSIDDVDDKGDILIITLPDSKTGKMRTHTITNKMCEDSNPIDIFRKYISLRPSHTPHKSLFVFYRLGKCTIQPIGIHTFEMSKDKYRAAYNFFMDWRKGQNNTNSFSEKVLLAYFASKKYKATTLWTQYSMLRTTLKINNNVDITKYLKLKAFLRRKSDGYRPKRSKVFLSDEINKFIRESPDNEYLQAKVVLIMGIMGACGKEELYKMQVTDIKDLTSEVIVKVPTTKTKRARMFTITGQFYEIFKKYASLRPENAVDSSFFLNYQQGKCNVQKLGKNKLGNMGKKIASFLRLPNPELYTGNCFRRSSATILIDSGVSMRSVRRRERTLGEIDDEFNVANKILATR